MKILNREVKQAAIDRFFNCIDKSGGPESCWLWTGFKVGVGYGLTNIFIDGKRQLAHRLNWIIANDKPIPEGLYACHTCDNPSCCNPSHIFISDQAGNMTDMQTKGRDNKARGESNANAKLTAQSVLAIRQLHAQGVSSLELAEVFSVHQSTVSRAVSGKSWRHVGGPIFEGTFASGGRSATTKLTARDVQAIKQALGRGVSRKTLAANYGVSKETVDQIAQGKIWKHI